MKIHRISLEAEAYARLAYISALEQISPKDWMEERIKEAWDHRDGNPIIQLDDKPKCGAVTVADIPQKRKRLADNPDALQQIRDMWNSTPRPSFAEMSKRLGYPKSTIAERLKAMRERGELVD